MNLPVPANAPLLPLTLYNSASPPYLPSIAFHPTVEGYRSLVATAVANEASQKATANPARMFVYNLFCQEYWNNRDFAENCKMAADVVAMMTRQQGHRDPGGMASEAASKVLTLFSSYMVMAYPALQGLVPPNVLQSASINAPQFDNLKREIQEMYQNNNGYNQPMAHHSGYLPQQGMPMYPQGGMYPHQGMQHPQQGMMMDPRMMHAGMQHPHAHLMQRPAPQLAPMAQGNGHMFGGYQQQMPMYANGDNEEDARFTRRNSQSNQQQHRVEETYPHHQQVAPAPKEPVQEVNNNELTIQEGSEMDRAKHQVVYFGESFTQNLDDRFERLAASTKELERSSSRDENSPVEEGWTFCSSIEKAVVEGQLKQQILKEKTGVDQIFRHFVVIATPIVTGVGMGAYWDKIRSCMTFAGMAKAIKNLAIALEDSKNEENKDEVQSTINFLTTIDNRLTNLVNRFLRISLDLNAVNIDSFTEDVADLSDYLGNNYGNREVRALEHYEREVHSALNHDLDDGAAVEVKQFHGLDKDKDYPLFQENYSFTHVFMNSRELGWRTNEKPLRINRDTTPALFSIVDSLSKHKKDQEAPTLHDMLVSSDNQIYHLYRDYRQPNEYMISQVMS